MEPRKSRIASLIEALIGVEGYSDSIDEHIIEGNKKRYKLLKRSFGIGVRLTAIAGLGVVILPLVTNKILELLGVGMDEAEPVDIKEIEDELEEEKSYSVTEAVRGLMGLKEEPVPPSITIPISKKLDLSGVDVVQPSERVLNFIDEAARIADVDKAVLLAVAHQESKFKEKAISAIGARGLLQITPRTWSYLVGKYGKRYGIKPSDRNNPRANTIIGAIYIKQIIGNLTKSLGHKPSMTDIYAGYFLGPRGAKRLLTALAKTPDTDAVRLFPQAARYNKNIFYGKDGKRKTVSEVYSTLYEKVGPQYLKFAQQQKVEPQHGVATSFESAQQKVAPVRVSVGKGTKDGVHSVSVNLPHGNTAAVTQDVEISLPQNPTIEIDDGTTLEREVKNNLSYSIRTKNNSELNFIRDKQNRLLTLEVQ